jgi:predicted TIM-barrel fold metal-dependent hydrolase
MIVDSHAYCFEPIDTPAGHASSDAHLRWVQTAHAHHHQPAWRIRDHAPVDARALAPQGFAPLSPVPDYDFRVDRLHGRLIWTVDGEDCTKHFFPPNLHNLEYTPHSLIAEMDYAGVDMALLHTDPMLGRDSAFLAHCVQLCPERLRAMAPVDEWRILGEMEEVIEEMRTAIQQHHLHAIKFIPQLAYLTSDEPWDDGQYRPFWQAATELDVPIFFTLGSGPQAMTGNVSTDEQKQGYLNELRILRRWMTRYPHTICSLTHGFPWRLFLEGDRIVLPEAVWQPFTTQQCYLEVCFPVRLGDLFDFPYREVWPTLAEMVERIGADRLLWGTDMPFQNRFCTYRQSRDWLEKYCDFLSQAELAAIMGETAVCLLTPASLAPS